MQNTPQLPQQLRKRKHTKTTKRLAGVGSFLAAIAAIVAILQFTLGIQNLPNLIMRPPSVPSPVPTLQSTSPSQPPPTPTPVPLHLIPCSATSPDPGQVKFFVQGGAVICFSGIGTISHIIQPVVRVETGEMFATWQYITLSTGISHHSPQDSFYNCPGKVAHYEGGYMIRVTQITTTSQSTSCS